MSYKKGNNFISIKITKIECNFFSNLECKTIDWLDDMFYKQMKIVFKSLIENTDDGKILNLT